MAERINPVVKAVLEWGPIAAFFLGYVKLKDETFTVAGTDYQGFIIVTAAFIPLMVICTGLLWWLSGKLSKMQVATVVLVVVFGGLSVWLNDDRFFKMKPTMIYLLFGVLLGIGLLRGQSWLRLVLEEAIPLQDEGWMILTRRVMAFFFALAIANEAVWRLMSTDAWVNFKTFGLPLAIFVFFMTQSGLFKRYNPERKDEA
ncbi:septation protein A [Rhodobacter sphaeroides]|jgi:intracellular septation protein|uniref:Inner membrane-spanning protein YciB n=1 Tax=Cereibacter sphaeroides (strain ATCC 17023 / DSM 158 / JCM 6121 / CCUG 31486 / LMG 2827 / NBRC 12203 / NCIMB 8253 / ATH 2.4.1.) TaxID=272943 RepID=Q3J5E4_CERS4|nr:inner membrane-spanning protein YciB [Cereibacter sphaeroides]ABN75606.1 Intracellular septation protein A [Cereibacter sphaeroides ATCC 17029]ABA77990.1 putative intracellular septation protein [Cereibacter sphaeroides 2.4.1]ACM00008.1 Intracellular septation protein A [Cereibacter sphaeroides KD131]AMJ46371.1 Intracellular septation protein A [Cereibacter sphaeroides]ANS33082.1 Intracellular septation protein A [Cereibacter sphaeroides]